MLIYRTPNTTGCFYELCQKKKTITWYSTIYIQTVLEVKVKTPSPVQSKHDFIYSWKVKTEHFYRHLIPLPPLVLQNQLWYFTHETCIRYVVTVKTMFFANRIHAIAWKLLAKAATSLLLNLWQQAQSLCDWRFKLDFLLGMDCLAWLKEAQPTIDKFINKLGIN